ncbi:hypothetical protein [Sphingomonas sp.]|uniref:hypothetical protein n=1 Tax=Sphingomonas sp. TaxID=28214 RepID=UPI003F6E73F0
MTLTRVRARATALRGRTGDTGEQGLQGEPGYKTFATWTAAAASTGSLDETIIVIGDSGTHTDPVVGGTVSNSGRFARRAGGLERIDDYSSTAQKFIVATVQPATPETGTSQALVEFVTPTNPASQPSPATMRITTTHNPYAANAQGFSHPAYTNKTIGMTVGYTTVYGKQISTEAGAGMIIEHGFHVTSTLGGTCKGAEFHWQATGADWDGYRPITAFAPWTDAHKDSDSSLSLQGAFFDMKNGSGTSIISWNFRGALAATKVVSLHSKVQFQHAGNGFPWLSQTNAAASGQLNMPYVNGSNGYTFDRDIYMSAGSVLTNPLGIQSLLTLNGTSGFATGARLVYLSTNSVTGSVTGFEAELSASTRFEGFKVRNTHASGNAGGRIVGNGNLYFDLFRETDYHAIGLRLKTNGDFTIGKGEQGSEVANAIVIPYATMQVQFQYPPKLPSYTVAGLPNPTTVAAGAQAFCTNETGGAVPVFSDGTDWRRVTDRTIAA